LYFDVVGSGQLHDVTIAIVLERFGRDTIGHDVLLVVGFGNLDIVAYDHGVRVLGWLPRDEGDGQGGVVGAIRVGIVVSVKSTRNVISFRLSQGFELKIIEYFWFGHSCYNLLKLFIICGFVTEYR